MMHNSDMLLIAPTSCQTCSKPHVVRSFFVTGWKRIDVAKQNLLNVV
jgi:hypothetical protein